MPRETSASMTIREIVSSNFHTAAVFEKYSLDFCCRGITTVEEATREKGIDPTLVMREIDQILSAKGDDYVHFTEWRLDFLIDYILNNHHSYVARMIPVLLTHTQKIAAVHGANHPEVLEIAAHFETVALELQKHMQTEEEELFPNLKIMLEHATRKEPAKEGPSLGAQALIASLESEHRKVGDLLYAIRSLSNKYLPPEDACTTYRVTYQELEDFERDLHQHVHLENNILFPKALMMERELARPKSLGGAVAEKVA